MSISVNDKNLGHVSAYAYAKSKGYTGTEEEFAELMASYATVAEAATASASAAAESATAAAESATVAAESATAAAGSASTANTKAVEASASATVAAESATAAAGSASTANTKAGEASAFATVAAESATTASESATTAAGSATDANTAKTAAQTAKTVAEAAKTAAAESATAAAGSATSANTNALKAEGYAVGKQNEADVASGSSYYQNNAKYYAAQAAGSASTANAKAGEASAFAAAAAGSTTAAAGSAAAAATSETNAAESATAAAGSASSAAGSASTANTKAGEAVTSATNAANSANTANTKAGEAAASATAASGSASTATTKASEASASATSAAGSATAASGSASTANTEALKSEGYAVGKQNGAAVASGSSYYQNNAKYYAAQALESAAAAATSKTNAAESATAAAGSASTVNAEALKSEGYAVGKQNGADVASDSPYYQNNAKYYAEETASLVSNAFTYRKIVEMLRMGQGNLVPNGTTFIVPHAFYGNIEFVTRGMNIHKVKNNPTKPTITIQSKYALSADNSSTTPIKFQYDRREAFAKVGTAIPAGTVCKFATIKTGSWLAGTYHFTASDDIPVGCMLGISGSTNKALDTLSVQVFASPKAATAAAQYAISSGDGGATVDFGTMGTDANDAGRVALGSGNDAQSNLFQFLNGNSGDGYMDSIFVQKTEYDMMSPSFTSLKGFLGGFPADFLACLGLCEIPNLTNNSFEVSPYTPNAHYTYEGYFFLPSRKELYGTIENGNESDETQFPYYAEIGTTDADKILSLKEKETQSARYWLRTPRADVYAYTIHDCSDIDGHLDSHPADQVTGFIAPLAILA